MKEMKSEFKLTTAELYALVTARVSSLNAMANMIKNYKKMTPEQLEKAVNERGPFSLDSMKWRGACSISHPGSVDEMSNELRALVDMLIDSVHGDIGKVRIG